MEVKKKFEIFALLALAAFFSFLISRKINLAAVDLGRHIRNGQDFFAGNSGFLRSNFYSYTHRDYPFLNHHWGTGVLFFLVYSLLRFKGLHLFFLFIMAATFFIAYDLAKKKSDAPAALILSVMVLPLLAYRKEVRAEIFSCFFAISFFWILWNHKKGNISNRLLWALPIMEIFWINTHIYFFLGPLIIAMFLLERLVLSFLTKNKAVLNRRFKFIATTFVASIVACIINPFGIKGALHPLNIYHNYGYRILEEQSIWFLYRLNITHPEFVLFKMLVFLVIVSFVLILAKRTDKFPLSDFFLACGFSAMACLSIRNIAIFGFFSLPILAGNMKILLSGEKFTKKGAEMDLIFKHAFAAMAVFGILIVCAYTYRQCMRVQRGNYGIGLAAGVNGAAEFFKDKNIKGPIFNNYDIGGYLIYHLYPAERIFVDNRPEVYPASFFNDIYIPMQQQEKAWKMQDEKYNFNAIFFYYEDATPWGQEFLISRINDPLWAPVFADNFSMIFLKRNNQNKKIIEEFEISRSDFSVRKL